MIGQTTITIIKIRLISASNELIEHRSIVGLQGRHLANAARVNNHAVYGGIVDNVKEDTINE